MQGTFLLLVTLLSLFKFSYSYSQNTIDTSTFIPKLPEIHADLKGYYEKKMEAEITEYNYSVKGKWLRFLPTVGFNVMTISPILGINSSSLVEYAENRAKNKAKIENIRRSNRLSFEDDSTKLIYELHSLIRRVLYYNDQLKNFVLEQHRFDIVSKSYENKEITPSQWLDKQIEFNNLVSSLKLLELELYSTRNQILSNYHFSNISVSLLR